MQAKGKERSLLRDLALIYIAMAHGTDHELSQTEVEAISERLQGWKTQVTEETVLSAIKDALADYTDETAREEVEAAIRRVREGVDQELLEEIVDDLTEIAMADDKFLHEEGSFIGELARAWDVHVEADEKKDVPWSVLVANSRPHEGWTPLHDLALVYLHLAHRTDEDLDTAEVEAIARTLNEWTPDIKEDRVLNVVQGAMSAYVQGPDKRLFEESIEALRESVPPHQRAAIVSDLEQIAQADGRVLPEEKAIIRKLSKAWEVEVA